MLLQRISASATCLFFYFATSALGANSTTGPIVHENIHAVPADWSHAGAPAPDQTMVLQIALQQQNLNQLESKLYAISTPGNPSYGHFMEGDEVKAMLAPSSDASPAVEAWLKSVGVTQIKSDGEWVTFATTVGTANKLLGTQFNYYESDGITKLRTTEYSLPKDVAQHIDFVTPTTYFGKTTAQLPTMPAMKQSLEPRQAINSTSNDKIDDSCKTSITPSCLKQIYNVGDYTPDAKSGSRIAFSSFLNESARTQDLSLFQQRYNIPEQGFTVQLINGGVNEQAVNNNHGEANLDAENISGVSHPLPVTEYITGGSPPFVPNVDEPTIADNQNEPYLNFYQYLLAQKNADLPQVISNSYGDDEQTVPEKYARRVCNMIGQLGMRGISVLESSGDTGVGAACLSNDGKKTPQFTPQFPGTCPYITAVGGTQALEPEVAWVASSGGFSNYFEQPSYQSTAVESYISNELNNPSYYEQFFNKTGRGFPDVSAHSLTPDYAVYVNNAATRSGGTSAACPVFSSIIALLNDARLRAGKPALGFLNPWLYQLKSSSSSSAGQGSGSGSGSGSGGLTDITAGQAVGCNGVNGQTGAPVVGGGNIPYATLNATKGWDPVTGLGVPDFQALLKIVLA